MSRKIRPRQDLTIANLGKMLLRTDAANINCDVVIGTYKGKPCIVIEPTNATCEEWINCVCSDPAAWWKPAHFTVIE